MNAFNITCLCNGSYEAQHVKTLDVFWFFDKTELCEFLDRYYRNPTLAVYAYKATNYQWS